MIPVIKPANFTSFSVDLYRNHRLLAEELAVDLYRNHRLLAEELAVGFSRNHRLLVVQVLLQQRTKPRILRYARTSVRDLLREQEPEEAARLGIE